LTKAHHKTKGFLSKEKEDSLSKLFAILKEANFRIIQYKHKISDVITNENTWRIILSDPCIREIEFGDAYDTIPPKARSEFISDFHHQFSSSRLGPNSHFCAVLAEKCGHVT